MKRRGKTSKERLINPIVCKLCGKELKNLLSLSAHLIQQHNHFPSKDYYNRFLKKEEGVCTVCGASTAWVNLGEGYKKFCSRKCAGIHRQKNPDLYPRPVFSDAAKKRMSRSGYRHSDESKEKISQKLKGVKHWWTTYPTLGKKMSKETKKKIKSAQLFYWGRLDRNSDVYREFTKKKIEGALSKVCERPNKFEVRCFGVLETLYPGEFEYVGDGSVLINFKSPDFICYKRKTVVLCNGIYWHLKRYGKEDTKENRSKVQKNESLPFIKAGYKVWFIWEEVKLDINEHIVK